MIFILFTLGLSIGSFLNVLIDRLPEGKSVIRGRSFCDHCKKTLAWYDLIPVLSFIILNRRCRSCHRLISWQYPFVELAAGLLFVFIYTSMNRFIEVRDNYFFTIIYLFTITSGLLVIFITDLKYRIIPDEILIVQIIISFAYQVFFQPLSIIPNFITGLVFLLFFLFLVLITRGRGMGLGDVKLAFVMGFILGFPNIIVAFYLSFLTGAAVSLILIVSRHKKIKSKIAFGPFLCTATFVCLFWGNYLWERLKIIFGL